MISVMSDITTCRQRVIYNLWKVDKESLAQFFPESFKKMFPFRHMHCHQRFSFKNNDYEKKNEVVYNCFIFSI